MQNYLKLYVFSRYNDQHSLQVENIIKLSDAQTKCVIIKNNTYLL